MTGRQLLPLWQALYAAHDPGQNGEYWELDGTQWARQRHVYWGEAYSFRLESHTLTCRRAPSWRLLVVKELHWGQDRRLPLKDRLWHKVQAGNPAHILAWLTANLPDGYGR